jgi:DNA-binding protein HU-beta
MNKAQLIDAISASAGLTKADAKKALDAFVQKQQMPLKKVTV